MLFLIRVNIMHSYTEENYIKAIFQMIEEKGMKASTNAIAEHMDTAPSSVSDMIRKLSEKNLINYEKYKGVTLTKQGRDIAISIVRKHRLWEVFLVEKLNYKWNEVHDIAEQLEHIQSSDLIDRIEQFLDYPKIDPHGDPIPNHKGEIPALETTRLSEVPMGKNVLMAAIDNHSTSFLEHLDKLGLTLGVEIIIEEIVQFDKSLQIKINQDKSIHISNEVSKNILVTDKELVS